MSELFPLQIEGVDWLVHRPGSTGLLGDEMGFGKSVEVLKAAEQLRVYFMQVICPAIARVDWERKMEEWWMPPEHAICSYEQALTDRKLLRARAQERAARGLPTLLALDEAHYLKNPAAKRTRAIYGGHCRGFGGIVDGFDACWPMTGTPMPNGDPREMYPHLRALAPYLILDPNTGLPLTYTAYSDRYCHMIPDGYSLKMVGLNQEHLDEFRSILSRFVLARPIELLDVPDLRFELYPMAASKVPQELAATRWPGLVRDFHKIIDAAGVGDLDAQLQTQLGTLRRLTGLLKIEATVELVGHELRDGTLDKVVVFAYHVEVVEEIARRLQPFGSSYIHGGVSEQGRWAAIDAFQNGHDRVIVGQITAASVNTTLTAAHNVVFAETDWVPANNLQAAARCRRVGTRFPVLARIIAIKDTIDELLQQAARAKINRLLLLNQR